MKTQKPSIKRFDSLAQNFFRQLAKGKEVMYQHLLVTVKEEKIIVKGRWHDKDLELHFRVQPGSEYGFSKEQFKNIFAQRAKPLYYVTLRSRDA